MLQQTHFLTKLSLNRSLTLSIRKIFTILQKHISRQNKI